MTGPDLLDDPARPRWSIRWSVLGWVVSFVLSAFAASLYASATGRTELDDIPISGTVLLLLPLWAGLLWSVWLASRRQGTGQVLADFRVRFEGRDLPVGFVIGVVTQLTLVPLYVLLLRALKVDTDSFGENAQDLTDRAHGGAVILLVLAVVICAPFVEELFYRGLLLGGLEGVMGRWPALVLSSVVFGAVHFSLVELVPLAVFGLIAGYLAQRTGRLGSSIAAHIGFNAVTVVILVAVG